MPTSTMLRGALPLAILTATCAAAPAVFARGPSLYWIDVEGGAATLILSPAGESVLIDSGNPGGRDAQRIVLAAREAGVNRLDHLVTTHFHIDHFGGAAEIAREIPIGTIYDNGLPEKNPDNPADAESFAKAVKPYRDIQARRVVLKPGEFIPLKKAPVGPSLSIECLGGMQKTVEVPAGRGEAAACVNAKEKAKDTSDNANSLVLLLKYGSFSVFDGGDLTWNNEARLVCPQNLVGTVDIYDVDHHGLDVSNNPVLIRTLQPTVAIMSNGTTKGCGPETFATLKSTPSVQAIYQIHRNLRADSSVNTEAQFIANAEKDCRANLIKVSVAEDGKSYAVSIPARGQSRTFQSH